MLNLFGPSLGREEITICKTQEVAPAVKRFGDRVRSEHPDASFKVIITVAKGNRKPAGFDAARQSGGFGECAFLRVEDADGAPVTSAPTACVGE